MAEVAAPAVAHQPAAAQGIAPTVAPLDIAWSAAAAEPSVPVPLDLDLDLEFVPALEAARPASGDREVEHRDIVPASPLTAEAWRQAMRALPDEAPASTGMIVEGLDPDEWRACVRALAHAEARLTERSAGRPAAKAGESDVASLAARPGPTAASEERQGEQRERRDPTSRSVKLRQAA